MIDSNSNSINQTNSIEIEFETSIGRIIFFRWALKNKVIEYIEDHLAEMRTDMKKAAKKK